jgi:hypothetical protein
MAKTTLPQSPTPTSPPSVSTRERAISLMHRPGGATLAELTAATGWQPHSARAVISGLRKAGLAITRGKRGSETCYTIAEQA